MHQLPLWVSENRLKIDCLASLGTNSSNLLMKITTRFVLNQLYNFTFLGIDDIKMLVSLCN